MKRGFLAIFWLPSITVTVAGDALRSNRKEV